jgi:methionyl-tRNA formyltransferase
MQHEKLRVVMLCGPAASSLIMYHGIAADVDVACVVMENKVPAGRMILRRIRKLGVIRTFGQLMFITGNAVFSRASRARIRRLMEQYALDDSDFPAGLVRRVESVNSGEVMALLKEIKPGAVVVNGTRIISPDVLASIDAPFLNTHMGITPRYRGVHGGYWALTRDDREHCGVTVHLVDPGIDTGGVLYQDTISVDRKDNFNTYPVHQIAQAIPLMKKSLQDVREGRLKPKPGHPPSKLWYHPTLWEYVANRIRKGVK